MSTPSQRHGALQVENEKAMNEGKKEVGSKEARRQVKEGRQGLLRQGEGVGERVWESARARKGTAKDRLMRV